jgi:WD40 repeat protein
VVNLDTGGDAGTLAGHAGAVFAVAASDAAARVATSGADGLVLLWDANTGSRLAALVGPTGAGDDWVILTDRGPACGPGVGRVQGAAVTADAAGVQAALNVASRPPAPAFAPRARGDAARKKAARP